ncbi:MULTISPECIES: efflux RND transporter periplasmic adaptor subunit [unclassified Variovorax]|uniref:efflux RND transporter periplasmic adaptor subunit n=1 Tax=unclassified Variovorax TaxID=663243 RepID=UPI001BD6BBE7|nr:MULTISPECIES: efflux RND transporter periplasmic adaptor subunit [unclassified Variovorax]
MSEQRHAGLAIHGGETDDHHDLLRRRQIVRRTRWLVLIVLVLLGIGAARTVLVRMSNAKELQAGTTERATQYVKTALPTKPTAGQTLALPGTLQGFVQSPINARASGYLKRWTRDIGARVQQGELLAEIETPEIDQQLSQAVAAREQAAAGLSLARSTVARWEALRQKDVVSQQDLDERRSAVASAVANLAAADANVQRLKQTEGFKRVLAPFAGVITRRNVDVGDLIDAGAGNGGRPLFLLSQTDPLRVYINVPQAYAQLIKAGQPVVVTQAELRGQTFKGEVARSSGAIDTATRMMQVEVSLPNREGILLPGAYVQVSLPLAASLSLTVPANALLFRAEGTRVALVDANNTVRLRQVTLGRNYGETVELLDGIAPTDRLVLNPSDSLAEGDVVALAKESP